MKSHNVLLAALVAGVLWIAEHAKAGGIWTALSNAPPTNIGHMHLLTDGTVLAEYSDTGGNGGPIWYRLKPDIRGSYINGTWSTNAAMTFTRQDFASQVLQNGKVMVAGGENGTGPGSSEVYDPVANTWTLVTIPAAWLNLSGGARGISDASSILLPDGRMLVAPVNPATNFDNLIYNPTTNGWSIGPSTIGNQNEGSWVKLADDSILTIDLANPAANSTNSERFIPSLNKWVKDAKVPATLFATPGSELGPALLLPNGKAIFFGGNNNTAIYTPSPLGGTNFGTWTSGPSFPNGQGMPDAAAAVLVNGLILCATSPQPFTGTPFPTPVSFYEFNSLSNTFTQVSAPGGGLTYPGSPWPDDMLALPDGNVLFSTRSTSMFVYHPTNGPVLAAGKPTVLGVSTNGDGTLELVGTLFNGLNAGAAYGDDEQEDSNYPLVRFTDGSGNVRYGRTTEWSSTAVMTGNLGMQTKCTLPPGASLLNQIEVVANGIPSDAAQYSIHNGVTWVDFNYTAASYSGNFDNPFNTMPSAVSGADQNGFMVIKASNSSGTIRITKPMRIVSTGGKSHIGP